MGYSCLNKDKMDIIEKGKDISSKDEAVQVILDIYHRNDVVIGELLESIELRGFSMREVVSVYAKAISTVEVDKVKVTKEGETFDIL